MVKLIISNKAFIIEQIVEKKMIHATILDLKKKGITGAVKIEEV